MENIFDERKNMEFIAETEISEAGKNIFFTPESKIISCEGLAAYYNKKIITKKSIVFSAIAYNTFILGICSIFLFGFAYAGYKKIYTNYIALIFVSSVFTWAIYYTLQKKRNFNIYISIIGLTIRKQQYKWQEIKKIYFIYRPNGNKHKLFIILALSNGFNVKEEITNLAGFTISENKIAAYIEYYRQLANTERKSP